MANEPSPRRIAGKPSVVVTRTLMPQTQTRMAELFDVTLNDDDRELSRTEILHRCQNADVIVPTVTDRIDAQLIAQLPQRLRLIASYGSGTDHIDLAAARSRHIIVTNTPGVFTDDTADMTMALMIGVMRRMREGTMLVRRNLWTGWAPSAMLGRRMGDKVLGIVGMGRIGQAVAHRARAFGMQIIYHNRRRLPESVERMFGASHCETLDELLTAADIVTLHCPASATSRQLVGERQIGLMKDGAVLINTARGDIVDYEALITALEAGALWGAGLDVYPGEPRVDERLLSHPNVVTQPHIGSATEEGRAASGERVIANIRVWADGHRPPDQVLEGWT
ncbi:D-glycerate dehydrogenase [Croceicoccus sp. F390]|uniref:D-glycerate dehydrogenase n=1 Tax=Croceicoccus esteveae TaxID=3075597 RepID=A0ABU2ZFY7_9SPHN|nr:D-glycerate dehydrogenase [Croceicoccus sp. F390]MDT0575515.1 D-glycerate dehydrogenase [Croceicoccus sp. F390]